MSNVTQCIRLRIRLTIQAVLRDILIVCHPLIDFARRLWNFVGPRLTDRGFAAGAALNIAFLLGFSGDPEKLNMLTLALWVGANFLFPTWDTLPTERLEPSGRGGAMGPGASGELAQHHQS